MRTIMILVGLLLLTAALAVIAPSLLASRAVAQPAPGGIAELMEQLWERVLQEQTNNTSSSFVFTVAFNTSISGLGNSVTFGQGLDTLRLQEAGEDYFCVARRFSRTTNVDCIPYTNVVKVSYSERQ